MLPKDEQELDYEALGAPPPTREEHGTEGEIAEALGKAQVAHKWIQKGSVLICIGCPWEHSTEPRFTDYLLQGTDKNGLPIMKKVVY